MSDKKWTVKFSDDELEGEQYAYFSSQPEALTWIKFVQSQERYDPSGFEVLDGPYEELNEASKSVASFDANEYVAKFKDSLGYQDSYMPSKTYGEVADSIARECALRMPYDTEAKESEGNAVMLLVTSNNDEAVKAGKKLGDAMMNASRSKKNESKLLDLMSDAYKALSKLQVEADASKQVDENEVLTEGKHWPEDYIKTACNLIKQSKLGQQSWYTDSFIKQDVQTFADEFTPLSHKSSNLGFFMAIVRWFIEYSGDSKQKYQEFIERKLDSIIAALLKIRADKDYDTKADEIKKMSFSQFEKLMDEVKSKTNVDDIDVSQVDAKYEVVPIYSYEDLHKMYGGDKTGYKGQSEWCHTNGKSTYESWTKNGTQMFFVIQRKDWKDIKAPDTKPSSCYDVYGMSLIAILVDVALNKLLNSTSRWNHAVLPKSGAADTMFESWQQLGKAVGTDVESICKKELADMSKKLQDATVKANQHVAKLLNSVSVINDKTISKRLRSLVTEVSIPDNVTAIQNSAFDECNNLTHVVIPNSITSIGIWAFHNCSSLKSVMIPNSVISIAGYAFANCTSLTSVTIGNGVTRIGYSTFWSCIRLTSVTIGNSVTSIGSSAFESCKGLTSVTIPDSVTSIREYAFTDCISLMSVTIGNGVTSIGERAFSYCGYLKLLIFKGKTFEEVQSMKDFPWGIPQSAVLKCKDGEFKLEDQLKVDMGIMLESCMVAAGRSPSKCICKSYDSLCAGAFAYDVVKKCLRDGMCLQDVCIGDDGHNYVASFTGTCDTSKNRRAWAECMQEVEQLVSHMVESGCGSVWLVDFINDSDENAWEMHLGFDLLQSPFNDDK